nr:kelch repeat-containing protein [Smithella sp.]
MKKYVLVIVVLFLSFLHVGMLYAEKKADFGGAGRYAAVGFAIDGKGYVGTGYDGSTAYKDFWEYDPVANVWTQKADFGGGKRYAAAGFVIDGKGYVGTGYDDSINYKDFWAYDPVANVWTRKTDFGGVIRNGAVGFAVG